MTEYRIQRAIEEDAPWLSRDDLATIASAAKELGMTISAIALMLDRGVFTTVIDPDAPERQGRRLLLQEEIQAYKSRKMNP